jgi:hypothetical protein
MAPRFYSKEWCEAYQKKANADLEFRKRMKGFTVNYLFVVTDDPNGNDIRILWHYVDGELVSFEYNTKPSPSDFRIGQSPWNESISLGRNQASYATFEKITKKEISGLAALGSKLWKMEGDLIKAMKYTANNAIIQEMQASVPVEY